MSTQVTIKRLPSGVPGLEDVPAGGHLASQVTDFSIDEIVKPTLEIRRQNARRVVIYSHEHLPRLR